MNEEMKAKRDELAKEYTTGHFQSDIRSHVFKIGFDQGFALAMEEAKVLVERLEILIAEGYANQIDKKALKEFKERSE